MVLRDLGVINTELKTQDVTACNCKVSIQVQIRQPQRTFAVEMGGEGTVIFWETVIQACVKLVAFRIAIHFDPRNLQSNCKVHNLIKQIGATYSL